MTKKAKEDPAPKAILASDPDRRLDAIIRRLGGSPVARSASRYTGPPALGKWGEIKDQMQLDESDDA